ncbi:DUF1659 domain-containing protein [Loigolactobacillus jiayinensis]|uniref:DUF1659 domain-containing protein n=1 Tax=Loigolactobacillus jiayinensis TaxID=2486016 RepID=A0ABW1RB93_9LACO|nr:hypothetical protein [Loigolactobacillus jiayinensis]
MWLKTNLEIKTVGDNIDGEATHKFVNVKEDTTKEQIDKFGNTIGTLADEGYSAAVTVTYDRQNYTVPAN